MFVLTIMHFQCGSYASLFERIRVPLQPKELTGQGMLFFRLLEESVAMHTVFYRDIVANPRPRMPRETRPVPPCSGKTAPMSLDVDVLPVVFGRQSREGQIQCQSQNFAH